MATYSDVLVGGSSQVTSFGQPLKLVTTIIDLSDATSVTATGDKLKIMDLSTDSYFSVVRAEVITAVTFGAATSGTLSLGDNTSSTRIINAATAANMVAGYEFTIANASTSGGTVLPADDDLNITLAGTGTITLSGKIAITYVVANSNNTLDAAVSPVTP